MVIKFLLVISNKIFIDFIRSNDCIHCIIINKVKLHKAKVKKQKTGQIDCY